MFKIKQTWLAVAIAAGLLVTACEHNAVKNNTVKNSNAPLAAPTADAISHIQINKSPNDDRSYAAILLPNQLQVVLVSDPSLENAAAALAVGVGSAQDPNSQPGLAHYLEHMLFLGTKKYPVPDSFFEFVQTNAGFTNAFTAYERTNFHFQVNAEKFDEALDRFSDYFKSPTLDPGYADKERNAVNSEWSMDHNQDSWILQMLNGLTANPANPHARFSIGNLETLADKKNSILQDELKAFYGKYYSANNMTLALIGKQSLPELKAMAEKHFSTIANKNIVRPKVTAPGLTQAEMGKSIHYQSLRDMKKLYVDFPIKSNKKQWALKVNEFVDNLLTSEEDGTLCEQLRKQGLANSVTAHVAPDEYGMDGFLRVDVDLTDVGLKETDRVIASVFAYTELMKKEGINERYFAELKAMRAKDFANAPKPDPFKQVVNLAMDQFELPLEHIIDSDYFYERFDADAVKALLVQLNPDNARIWYINQHEKADKTIPYFEGKYTVNNFTGEERLRWSDLGKTIHFNLPPENNLFTDKPADIVATEFLKPHAVVSQAGVEAFLVQPEFYREDKGVISLEINVDFAQQSPKNIVISNLLSDIYRSQNITLLDRADRASLKTIIEPSHSNSQLISVSGYTTKHADLLKQLLENYVNLTISEKDFFEALDKYKQSKVNAKKAPPFKQAFTQIRRLSINLKVTDSELLAEANKIKMGDVVAYYKATKNNPLIRLYAFGNYSEDSIKKIALASAQQLPSRRLPSQRTLPHYFTPANNKPMEYKDSVAQADNALVDTYFRDKQSIDEQAQLVVLNSIYRNAFFNQLRTNEQMGYVVTSSPLPVNDYPGFMMVVQSTNTDLPGIKARMDKFRTEFQAQLQAVEPAVIEQFKKAEAADVLQKPTDFYVESERYKNDFWNAHYDFLSREHYLASLEKVNKENIQALYQKMLVDKQSMHLMVQLKGTSSGDKGFAPASP